MKISEITIDDLKAYSHVYITDDDNLFTIILASVINYISSYTGLPLVAPPDDPNTTDVNESDVPILDDYEDLTMAVFVLANDMYDNRIYNVDRAEINPIVSSILGMHSVNLL